MGRKHQNHAHIVEILTNKNSGKQKKTTKNVISFKQNKKEFAINRNIESQYLKIAVHIK